MMDSALCSIERDREAPRTGDVDLEAQLSWGGDPVAVVHAPLVAGRSVRLRELGLPGIDASEVVIARRAGTHAELVLPDGVAVAPGHRLRLRAGTVSLRLALVARAASPAGRFVPEPRVLGALAGVGLLHSLFLVLAFVARAGVGDQEREALVALRTLALALPAGPAGEHDEPLPGSAGAPGPSPVAPIDLPRSAGAPIARTERHPTRDDARSFGMIAVLGAAPTAPALFGDEGLDQAGDGALFGRGTGGADLGLGAGLSGVGAIGGGRGDGIALGAIAGLGVPSGTPSLGIGTDHGRGGLGGGHEVRAPVACRCAEVTVSGRLPPEIIQRVVRQSFGRFRACYEDGLRRDPSLEGRLEVAFLIDRAGRVVEATTSGFRDAAVASCVSRAYEALTFPEPTGGVVNVRYPLVFSA